MLKPLIFTFTIFFPVTVFAFLLPSSISITPSEIYSVYDGGTFRAYLYGITKRGERGVLIRVRGLDSPEIVGKCSNEIHMAINSREFAKSLLFGADKITLTNLAYDKYNRLLATITINDEHSFAERMIVEEKGRVDKELVLKVNKNSTEVLFEF